MKAVRPEPVRGPVERAEERARRHDHVAGAQIAASGARGDQAAHAALVAVALCDDLAPQPQRQGIDLEVGGGSFEIVDEAPDVRDGQLAETLRQGTPRPPSVAERVEQPVERAVLTEVEDLVLPAEIVIQVARREIRRTGDLAHAGGSEPMQPEDARGSAQDLDAPRVGAAAYATGGRQPCRRTIVRRLNHGSIVARLRPRGQSAGGRAGPGAPRRGGRHPRVVHRARLRRDVRVRKALRARRCARSYNRPMRVSKYAAAIAAVAAATGLLELVGSTVNGVTAAQVLLLVLLLVARFCGTRPALIASVGAAVAFARYFVTPGGFATGDPNDWTALVSFIIIAAVGGELASRAERRAAEAQAGRQEIERLYQELQAAFDRASEAEAARRNEQLKAALLDALTHNLRTPLTAIKASVTALIGAHAWAPLSSLTADGQRELLVVIDEESDRLNRFIEGLSTPERQDSSQPLHLRAIGLDDIVRAGLARAETVVRDHHVRVSLAQSLPRLSVDAASVAEVVYILLDNASKYSPPGTTITITGALEDDRHVRVSVSDEGPGITAEFRDRVFEKFFRIPAREPADPGRGGVGLGLPIARRLVEAQTGQIWIETPPSGRGTVVAMTLPTAAASEDAPAAMMSAAQ
jgi:signal transduction histidine kinase